MIKAEQIKNKKTIIQILNYLKPYEEVICTMVEGSFRYENACEWVAEWLFEIDEALIRNEKITNENMVKADIRMMAYWDYLKCKISTEKLFKTIKKYSNGLLIEI
jgi:hypothetical protein